MVHIEKKWIEAEQASFKESVNEKTGKKEFILETKIFPYDKKSRNGVKYNKESALATKDNIVGITLNHNHVTSGENNFPRGEWYEAYDGGDGLYGRAKVYDTTYNKEYIEWLSTAENIKVSLQVSGNAESKKDDDGKWYREAKVEDWLEISTVNLPGFIDAKANFEKVMCEMVQLGEKQMKEGTWKLGNKRDIQKIASEVDKLAKKAYNIVGDDEFMDGLDKAKSRAEELANNVKESLEESITKLEFADEETTQHVVDILKKNNIKHLPNIRKSVILFNNEEDKKTAKMILIRLGMKGLEKQSADTSKSLKEDHLKIGDQVDMAGVKVEVTQVTDDGYVVKELEVLNNEPVEESTEIEQFYSELNKIRSNI